MLKRLKATSRLAAALLAVTAGAVIAQEGGVFTAGDIWESFLPSNAGRYYGETADQEVKMELRIQFKKDFLKTLNFYNSQFKCFCL